MDTHASRRDERHDPDQHRRDMLKPLAAEALYAAMQQIAAGEVDPVETANTAVTAWRNTFR